MFVLDSPDHPCHCLIVHQKSFIFGVIKYQETVRQNTQRTNKQYVYKLQMAMIKRQCHQQNVLKVKM
ncbi:hypothetical protein P5673_011472 [Acropora cervicornis]|uniref:Uncharacterized protein n=1 Tax=Acropora cervicornis TaxID=6130 RepID=A0AAD9QPK5_ACRCE|nr:hypothetical protein P5673_011472 [Acropora cervicornis]